MAKLTYIARRKPGFTRDQFIARWRKHGALAMSQQLWSQTKRYVQASVIPSASIDGVDETYDAIGVLWFKDARHMTTPTPADLADVAEMAEDEFETFSGPVQPGLLRVAAEEVLKDVGAGRTTAYLFFDDLSRARRAAQDAAARDASHRATLNIGQQPDGDGLRYAAGVEIAALDLDGLRAALGGDGVRVMRPSLALVAREAVLWE